jgi:hypothetical protein
MNFHAVLPIFDQIWYDGREPPRGGMIWTFENAELLV